MKNKLSIKSEQLKNGQVMESHPRLILHHCGMVHLFSIVIQCADYRRALW
jgi:hypothetical protein